MTEQPVIILARPQRGIFQGIVRQRDARTGWRPSNDIAQLERATEADALQAARVWAEQRLLRILRVGPARPVRRDVTCDPTPLCSCGTCADGAVTCTGSE